MSDLFPGGFGSVTSRISQASLEGPSERIEDSDNSSLTAPKPFFGHQLTVEAVDYCRHVSSTSAQELEQLRQQPNDLSHQDIHRYSRIAALEGRRAVYELLEQEAQALLAEDAPSISRQQLEPESSDHEEISSDPSVSQSSENSRTAEPITSFILPQHFYRAERQQRQQLKIATFCQEKAVRLLREIRYKKKFCALLKERGQLDRAKYEEQIVAQLDNSVDYYSKIAHKIFEEMEGYSSNAPGAHQVVAAGNYEVELPVKSFLPPSKAQEIKNPNKRDLIRLRKGKAEPYASLEIAELSPKKPQKQEGLKKQLPVAKKSSSKKVIAEFPRDLNLPVAEAEWKK